MSAVPKSEIETEAHQFGSELQRMVHRAKRNFALATDQRGKSNWRLTLWKLEDAGEFVRSLMAAEDRPR